MTIEDALYKFFLKFLGKERIYSKTGVVSDVNETTRLCNVLPNDGSPLLYNVRLQTIKDSSTGFVVIPKNGTECIVSFINKSTAFLSSCEESDKLIVDCDTLIQFNGGTKDGLVTVNELVTKLNNLESDLNALKLVFGTTWIVAPSDGGAALKLATAAWAASTLSLTVKANIENTEITQ